MLKKNFFGSKHFIEAHLRARYPAYFNKAQSSKDISTDDCARKILLIKKRYTFGQLIRSDFTGSAFAFHSDTGDFSSHIRGKED